MSPANLYADDALGNYPSAGGGGISAAHRGGFKYPSNLYSRDQGQYQFPHLWLFAVPFAVYSPGVISSLDIRVTSAGQAGAVVRLGVFADAGMRPGALLADLGTVAADTTGVRSVTGAVSVPTGLVWLGHISQNCATTAPSMATPSGVAGAVSPWVPIDALGGWGATGYRIQSSGITGALPASWPTSPATQTHPDTISMAVTFA